jgi:hypothetical protein
LPVIFQHIPLCMEREDEIDISFLNINKPVRTDVLDALTKAGLLNILQNKLLKSVIKIIYRSKSYILRTHTSKWNKQSAINKPSVDRGSWWNIRRHQEWIPNRLRHRDRDNSRVHST